MIGVWGWVLVLGPGELEGAQARSRVEPVPVVEPASRVEPEQPVEPAQRAEPAQRVEPEQPVEPAQRAEPAPVAGPAIAPQPPRFVEPQRVPARDRRPRGRTISRFTDRPPLIRPVFRVAPGFSARPAGSHRAAFAFDMFLSTMYGLHGGYRQWGLAPELGYSLRTPRLEHRLLAGLGLVYGINAEAATVGWLPRLVVQPDAQAWGLGVRNGLWFNFAENGFSVELSHQWLQRGGVGQHELQVSLGIDLAMLVLVITNARMAWL
jgi:hypothetical protein